MLSPSMMKDLNDQIRMEFQSSYAYIAVTAWCDLKNLRGAAHFFRIQHEEELAHALRLFDYVVSSRHSQLSLQALDKPKVEFNSLLEIFEYALENEQKTTQHIRQLLDKAHAEHDYATVNLLNWFAVEQAEEETLMDYFVDRLKLVGKDGTGLILVDNELLARKADSKAGEVTGAKGE